ncbi:MAG: isopeptide-forming domain-containing fimbrial protein, partial [Phycisphaerae bacterium]|nr:isopeptide-forming domain-containing fimbrial protein [Phycisphaerae bacterium]
MSKIRIVLAGLALLVAGQVAAQTPQIDQTLPAESFLGEQFCFETNFTNTGSPGYGPYLRVEVSGDLTLDSAEVFGTGTGFTNVGTFPASPGNQLTDPITGQIVTGTPGNAFFVITYPVGSVVDGGPDLPVDLCFTIDPGATVGASLPVSITPMYEFGDTPTGDNGPITGSTVDQGIVPTVLTFSKSENAPESERPPATTWPYTYTLAADIANTATINPLVIGDELPADFQYTGPVNITGGTGCTVTSEPSTLTPGGSLEVTCSGNTVGTTSGSDVVVSYSGYIIDTLDETVCTTEDQVNNASADGTYVPASGSSQILPPLSDTTTVTAKHVAVQKGVSPGQASPGAALDYTLEFQVTDFGDADSLVVTDILPDGIDFVAHDTLTVNGSSVAISPSVTVNGDFTKTVVYDIGAVAGTIPAGSAITLQYDAQLRQDYQDTGEPILSSDTLTNSVTTDYSLVQGASGCSDGSGATVDIIPVALDKQIVNVQPFYVPGEPIIFRLTLDIPAGDTSEIRFEDFFPLPVIDVADIDTTFGNDIVLGPNHSDPSITPDSITVNASQNALFIDWPDVTSTTPETIEVDVSAPINDIPFPDGLFLTNILLGSTENTPGQSAIATGPVSFQVGAPDMVVTKGVSATDGNGSINPSPGNLPVDGDITGIDAGDTITYTITAENRGSAQAYDVTITDPTVPGLTGCGVSGVTDGTGSVLGFTGSIATGILLDDPLAANDGSAGAPYGTDTALVTVDCQAAADLAPDSTVTNTASLNWASQGGAADFPTLTDDATAESTNIDQQKYFIASSEPGTSDGASPPRATIGEIVRYRAAVRIPEGEISQLSLRDNLPSGLTFLDDGTATAAFISNGAGLSSSTLAVPNIGGNASGPGAVPSGSITFAVPAGAISGGPFANGTDPVFAFGDVTNADSDADDEFLLLEFNALVNNAGAGSNDSGDNRNNNFTTLSNGSALNGTSNNVQVRVAEPAVGVAKSATPATGDADDTISFNVTVTAASGANRSPAHEVEIVDTLPSGLAGLSGLTITPAGCTAPGIVDSTVGDSLDIFVDTMSPGCQIDIAFDATLQNTVAPGTSITNTADATWTSLPGTNGTTSNPTGSATPGTPGSDNGERDSSGGINDYADSGSDTVSVESVAVTKGVTSTSEIETSDGEFRPGVPDLVVGESATFDITVTIPEGTTPQVVITDTVPFSNGLMRVDNASVVSVGGNLTPAVPSPSPAISDTQMGDGIADTVSFDFGQVDNTPDNAVTADDRIVVRVEATLVDEAANVNDDDLTNNVLVQFGPGLDASASADVDVVEPILSVDKSGSITQGDAGDSVTYTVTLQHTSGSAADAQDLVFDDPLPADLALNLTSINVVSGPPIDVNNSSGNTVSLGWTDLLQSETIVLEYEATLTPGVQPSETLTNTATLDWDSIAGANPDERTNNDSDSHSVLVTQPGLAKVVFDTSETSTGNGEFGAPDDLTIGEEVTYRFTTVFAEGTSDAVVVTDQLPTGSSTLEVVSSQVISVGGNLSGASLPSPGDPGTTSDTNADTYDDRLEWSFGTIQNAPDGAVNADDEITFEVVAQVIDVSANQSGDTDQLNTATLTTATSSASGTVGVDIVAPDVDLAKSIVDPADGFVDAGDTMTVRLDIDH